jgi:hypothetical protein
VYVLRLRNFGFSASLLGALGVAPKLWLVAVRLQVLDEPQVGMLLRSSAFVDSPVLLLAGVGPVPWFTATMGSPVLSLDVAGVGLAPHFTVFFSKRRWRASLSRFSSRV